MTDSNLGDISTNWSRVKETSDEDSVIAREAMSLMISQYSRAIRRYISVFFRDPNTVDDVYHSFLVKLLRGDLRNASPDVGPFRSYLKVVLRNHIRSHQVKYGKECQPLPPQVGDQVEDPRVKEEEEQERIIWQQELLSRAWEHLENHERSVGRELPYDVLLHYRESHPSASSAEVAAYFSEKCGKPIGVQKVRTLTMKARDLLKKSLYNEVANTLAVPSVANVEQELIDLGFYRWLADTVEEMRKRAG